MVFSHYFASAIKKYWYVLPTLLSLALHLLFWNYPQQAVFDEVYFPTFAQAYFTGAYYFDIHPPLGKLLLSAAAWVFGYHGGGSFSAIGVDPGISWWQLCGFRILPMIAGVLIPLVVTRYTRSLGASQRASLLAGTLVALESGLLVQTRFAFLDGFLLLFGFASLWIYQVYRRFESRLESGTRRVPDSRLLVLSYFFGVLAFDIKWTGLTFLGLIAVQEIVTHWRQPVRLLLSAIQGFAIAALVYITPFIIHFALLPNPGPGDAFMLQDFREHGIQRNIIDLNQEMLAANNRITDTHSYGSAWYSWPFMLRPVFYWSNGDDAHIQRIYYFGNPVVYVLVVFALVYLLVHVRAAWMRQEEKRTFLFLLLAFSVNLFPFLFIHRVMFLYHYLPALLFGIVAVSFAFDSISDVWSEKKTHSVWSGLIVATALVFAFFFPIIYGLPSLNPPALQWRQWLPTWK
jgi:dolichyl-phosphate-mannose--protein O-mannosyl transferase